MHSRLTVYYTSVYLSLLHVSMPTRHPHGALTWCLLSYLNVFTQSWWCFKKFTFYFIIFKTIFFYLAQQPPPQWAIASSFMRFLDHTQRRNTVGRTPLDEWSARRGHLYLTTHNTHNRQTSMLPVGFEPKISVGERPQTYILDRAATETGNCQNIKILKLP